MLVLRHVHSQALQTWAVHSKQCPQTWQLRANLFCDQTDLLTQGVSVEVGAPCSLLNVLIEPFMWTRRVVVCHAMHPDVPGVVAPVEELWELPALQVPVALKHSFS